MPMPTVAIDVPSAQVLADQASIISELQFVMDCCKRLLADLAKPEEERDPLMPLALWSSAVLAYGRCFSKGKRFTLSNDDVRNLPLHGAVMKFHQWILEERDKLAARAANPAEGAKVGAALSPPEQKDRRVEGIVIFASSREVVDFGEIAIEMEQLPFVVLERRTGGMERHRLPAAVPDAAMAEHLEILR